jgi:methylglutaconyl-CoA hydratase
MPGRPPPAAQNLRLAMDGPVARIALVRPERRNAFDAATIAELADAFRWAAASACRCVVLSGDGPAFCAGADLGWMQAAAAADFADNVADALALADMLAAVRDCPSPVVARVHGLAFGGGAGLVAAVDVAVCAADTRFAFSEVRLGLAPAVIAPFVLARIGPAAARELFLTGESFGAEEARSIGLVRHVCAGEDLDAAVAARVEALLEGGPQAQAAVKRLLSRLAAGGAGLTHQTAVTIAERRASDEGREGMAAFFAGRRAPWKPVPPPDGGSHR